MKVFKDIDSFIAVKNPVVTTGTFDGVHLGHQKIISRLKEIAYQNKGETLLITFHPHPRLVLFPDDNDLLLLNTQEEKIELLNSFGVDNLLIIPFTKEFSRLSSLEFVRTILVNKIKTKKLVIGYNHHFGRNREGSFEHLKEYGPIYGFEVEEIPAMDVDSIEISSTKIRNALLTGDVKKAASYLGHEYVLSGTVVKGKQLGRTLGYPTANIEANDKNKLIPANGIYAVWVKYADTMYKGMMSIGFNPTIGINVRTIEVNIFDFDKDIYGETLKIYFKQWLRNEEKFNGLDALTEQLLKDKQHTLQIL